MRDLTRTAAALGVYFRTMDQLKSGPTSVSTKAFHDWMRAGDEAQQRLVAAARADGLTESQPAAIRARMEAWRKQTQ